MRLVVARCRICLTNQIISYFHAQSLIMLFFVSFVRNGILIQRKFERWHFVDIFPHRLRLFLLLKPIRRASGRLALIVVHLLQQRGVPLLSPAYSILLSPSPSILLLSAIASLALLNQPLPLLVRFSHVSSFTPHFTACLYVIFEPPLG